VRQAGGFVARIPEFDRDVHDLGGLAAIADLLQGSESQAGEDRG
jgi:hypothetical protein